MLIHPEDGMIVIMICMLLGDGCRRHLNGFTQSSRLLAISEWDSIQVTPMEFYPLLDLESGLKS
jgi:hypothetical protein